MSNLTRRLRLDFASLLSATVEGIAEALDPASAGAGAGGPQFQVTGLDLALPVRFETTAGPTVRVRLPSRLAPQPGHPGSITVEIRPSAEAQE